MNTDERDERLREILITISFYSYRIMLISSVAWFG